MRVGRLVATALVVLLSACQSDPRPTIPSGPRSTTTSSTAVAAAAPTTVRRVSVLVFHKTAGFTHASIPAGLEAVAELGIRAGFDVEATDEAAVFGTDSLTGYDVIVFLNTTGDVLSAPQQVAMEEFIRRGGGFVGIHAAADTEYDWAWYGGLVGTWFQDHPPAQVATVRVVEGSHPAIADLPETFERFDEWYNFRTQPDVTTLLAVEEATYQGGTMGDHHPITWAHEYDGGRSFYTAFGHTVETYSEPAFLSLLAGAIVWAAG